MSLESRALGGPRTRAEIVRDRRARQIHVIETGRHARKALPRRPRSPRRRYDLSLASGAGIALRLPVNSARRIGPRMLSAMLLALTIWALSAIYHAPDFRVGEPIVRGAEMLSEAQVRSIAQVSDRPVFLVDTESASKRLKGYSEISSVSVQVEWPNRLIIDITERQPVALWEDGGRNWWLSEDGVALIERGDRPGLIKIRSHQPVLEISDDPQAPSLDPRVLQTMEKLSADLPKGTELQYEKDQGLVFEDPRGWRALFGTCEDIEAKLNVYQAIVQKLLEQGLQVEVVSVENPAAPYYRIAR